LVVGLLKTVELGARLLEVAAKEVRKWTAERVAKSKNAE
jgi:hypothetical protein